MRSTFKWADASLLRDRIAQVLPEWDPSMPGYSSVLAMYAFGLEENGEYAPAERIARQALAIDPDHPGAIHVLAHVRSLTSPQTLGSSFAFRPWSRRYANVEHARFADDLVILIDAYRRHDWLMGAVEKRLREEFAELQVEINEEKSRIVDLGRGDSFGFLGFDFRRMRSRRGAWRAEANGVAAEAQRGVPPLPIAAGGPGR
jgi:hypothetical protein